jgi:hypothetical protein
LAGASVLGSVLGGFSVSKDARAEQRKVAATQPGRGNGRQRGLSFRFLTNDPSYTDERPCFSPQGDRVLFMRGLLSNQSDTTFWTVPVVGGEAEQFFPPPNTPLLPYQATRPDWSRSRRSYEIAFTAQFSDTDSKLYLLDAKTLAVQPLPINDTKVISYPSWYPDGQSLAVTDYDDNQLLRVYLDQSGASPPTIAKVTSLTDTNAIWAGMSSVSPNSKRDTSIVAFAGQTPNETGYNQNANQIWIQNGDTLTQLDQYQARTPWWSPDGKLIAFESGRGDGGGVASRTHRATGPTRSTPRSTANRAAVINRW